MITILGIVTIAAVCAVWFLKREWMQFVVGVAVAFPQTAGLIVLGNGFPLFYLAVVMIAVLSIPYLLFAIAAPDRVPAIDSRGLTVPDRLALALVAWAAVITIAGPRIFRGMRVFAPELGVDAQVTNMAMLQPSLGNLAQLGYLTFAVLFLLLSGRMFQVDRRILGTALWVSIVLAAVRIVAEPFWPRALLQNMPTFNYATPERLSGTFYEPSVLGLYLVAAAGYFVARLFAPSAGGRIPAVIALALVAIDFAMNESGTALLGLGVLGMLAAVFAFVRLAAAPRQRVRPLLVAGSVAAIGLVLTQLPLLVSLAAGSAEDKADSKSFVARTASNLRSLQITIESAGLGIGLGGNRPSSFFFLVLSCLGILGLGLLAALVVVALTRALRIAVASPAAWGLAGVLIAAIVAVPDLSMPVIWISLAACLFPWRPPQVEVENLRRRAYPIPVALAD
ncbi:hypothetical protein QMG83_00915 [Salinibacterium sp. G-O1]|uniref:hypothetical protein n=1 Tax=Salinibacterium sp. G-O1 TaxID=3046208 RepID=UPI0024BAAA30|nr:hypothetical protein [Salinibacterium sp. G-O1]MDJ0333776.1 hypothetical protein [Salinibacterium sp. G-O1]